MPVKGFNLLPMLTWTLEVEEVVAKKQKGGLVEPISLRLLTHPLSLQVRWLDEGLHDYAALLGLFA